MAANADRKTIERLIAPCRVDEPEHFQLSDHSPAATDGIAEKQEARGLLASSIDRLRDLQARLAAQETYGVLVILQAIDAGGKDSAIRHVMSGLNPQGVRVVSFKEPSAEDLAHHFLWRSSRDLPRRGEIGIFNRSHYEEVLVVRVRPHLLEAENLPPEARGDDIWQRRFREINDWERMLTDNGYSIVKIFLHLSRDEQRRRLLARIDHPEKHWKFSMADIGERARWDEYQTAFEDMIRHTSTGAAPWYVVPADHKWYSRVVIAEALNAALMDIDPQFPSLSEAEVAELNAARDALLRD